MLWIYYYFPKAKGKNIIWLKFSNDREKQKTNYSWKYIVDILNT